MGIDVDVDKLVEELKTTKERVEFILEHYPHARENDFYLYLLYLRLFSPKASKYIKFIPFEDFKEFPSFETISRVRRKLNEEGKYLPTNPNVLKRRKRRAQTFKKAIMQV